MAIIQPGSNRRTPTPSGPTRVDYIIAAYNNGQISSRQAQRLLANPTLSIASLIATNEANVSQNAPQQLDVPYVFTFNNYREFYAPIFFGDPKNPKARPTVLPVTPEEIQIGLGNTATTISTVGGRTYSHAVGIDLEKISFSGYLPNVDWDNPPSTITPTFNRSIMGGPGELANKFREAMKANQPLIFAVHPLVAGSLLDPVVVPVEVTITNFTRTVKHGHGADIFYEMELQRWYPQQLAVGPARASNSSPPSNDGTKPQRRKYTVKNGDTLASIAHAQLDNIHRWREIYMLNKKRLDPPRPGVMSTLYAPGTPDNGYRLSKLRAGVVLLIPKR